MRALGLILAVSFVCVAAAGCDLCGNEVLGRVIAPSGEMSAVIFQRSCGATTPFSTQVSLLAVDEQPNGMGNVFRADTDNGKAPTGPGRSPEVAVRWIDAKTLEIRHHPKARIFAAEERVGSIRIVYGELGS